MKLLKIIFLILIIVTIGEAGYYLLKIKSQKNGIRQTEIPRPTATSESLSQYKPVDYLQNVLIPEMQLEEQKGFKYKLIREETGFVGKIINDSAAKIIDFQILDADQNEIEVITIKRAEIEKHRFYKRINGNKQSISYEKIQSGDKISVVSYLDLSDLTNNYRELVLEL